MNLRKVFASLCFATFSLSLVGCKVNTEVIEDDTYFTVSFDTQGGNEIAPVAVLYGETVAKPTDPTRESYEFTGWYEDKEAVTPFDFTTKITADWTLYAGWKIGSTPIDPPEEEGWTLYFRDAAWWNKDEAQTWAAFDGGKATMMTHIEYVKESGYNYWKIEMTGEESKVVFSRQKDGADWGAQTVEINLADRGDNDMYDISNTTAAWKGNGNYVTGTWAKYAK